MWNWRSQGIITASAKDLLMALVMERGRWTQDIFGDGTVGTSNELNVVMN